MPSREQPTFCTPQSIKKEHDIFLSYNHKDKEWVDKLASSIESEQFDDRYLKVFRDDWDIMPGSNVIQSIEQGLKKSRYVGIIISENSIDAEWPNMEWSIAISSDPSGRKGNIIPMWLGNCEIPPSLKIRNVLYCNTDAAYNKSYSKLMSVLKNKALPRESRTNAPQNTFSSEQFPIPYEDEQLEQLASNLFPMVHAPKVIWSGSTKCSNADVYNFLKRALVNVLPAFIVRERKIFCFWNLNDKECPFRNILSSNAIESDSIYDWVKSEKKNRWLMELLNKGLRNYCAELSLRFDNKHRRFYFPPENNTNRKIQWDTGKKNSTRTVTAKHTRGQSAEIFWAHQALVAKFITISEDIFLQLVPGWIFTANGVDPLPSNQNGPLSTKWTTNERNPSIFYHIRFWLSYLSKQTKMLQIPLGNAICEIDTVPAVIELHKGLEEDYRPIEKVFDVAVDEIKAADVMRKSILNEELDIDVEGEYDEE